MRNLWGHTGLRKGSTMGVMHELSSDRVVPITLTQHLGRIHIQLVCDHT